MKSVIAKLGKMRKAVSWTIYSVDGEGKVVVQSDSYIGRFDTATGEGVLSDRRASGAYFRDLMFAKPYSFPREFVTAATESAMVPGDRIGAGVIAGGTTGFRIV